MHRFMVHGSNSDLIVVSIKHSRLQLWSNDQQDRSKSDIRFCSSLVLITITYSGRDKGTVLCFY